MITTIQEQLARDEGCSLTLYPDTEGFWTIGIGHNTGTKNIAMVPLSLRSGISEDVCDSLFSADLHHVWDLLDAYPETNFWNLLDGSTGPRSNVLVNAAFNLGVAGLASFTTFLGLMRKHDWEGAAADLEKTHVFAQLPERYGRLQQQILTGAWQ